MRLRWDPRRFGTRFWLVTAACIWIVVKLPQEYWIHVAQLDFTDTWQDVSWFAPLVVGAVLVGLAILWFVVRPRLLPTDWSWRLAADPLPDEMDTAAERDAWTAGHVRVLSWSTVEKVVLIGLLSTIYARILPGLEVSDLRMFVGVAVFVVANAAISIAVAKRTGTREGLAGDFGARVVVNLALVLLARLHPGRRGPRPVGHDLLRAAGLAARHDARPVRAGGCGARRARPAPTRQPAAPVGRPDPPAPRNLHCPERVRSAFAGSAESRGEGQIWAVASWPSSSGARRSMRAPPSATPTASRPSP